MGGRPSAPPPPPPSKPVAEAFTDLAENQGKKLKPEDTPGTQAYRDAQMAASRRRARGGRGSRSLLGGGRGEGGQTTLGAE